MKKKIYIILSVVTGFLLVAWYLSAMWKGVMDHTVRDVAYEITKNSMWKEYRKNPFPTRNEASQALTSALAQHTYPPLEDRWGTAYKIDIIKWSSEEGLATIRSAGPDRSIYNKQAKAEA